MPKSKPKNAKEAHLAKTYGGSIRNGSDEYIAEIITGNIMSYAAAKGFLDFQNKDRERASVMQSMVAWLKAECQE